MNVKQYPISKEIKRDFVEYAKEINNNRAFPYLRSGLKPVHGHILWCMWANGRRSNKPYTKSAKVEGEVMSYNPHGSSYQSIARMAQDFIYHLPYIDGHGAFGSAVSNDTVASSRYTEMRLAQFIEDVLFYNTKLLDMGLNYLEEDSEPILKSWTALLPLLFITNTSGMGYTISNTWSSGNLFEFREQMLNYMNNGEVDCSKVFPDFPIGGVIINKSDMKTLYETGKGTIKLRGKTEINGDTIRILSLPYQVFPEQFLTDVKKYVSENAHTIKDVRNMCGMKGFLIEVDCEKETAQYALDQLFKKTCLQINISNEFKAVTDSGRPEMINLKTYIASFVEDNLNLVIKEANLNLEEISARLEIVDGLLSALDIIDEIIALIKSSSSQEDARQRLVGRGFTERQAEAIVKTPLGRLANLEQIKLQEEKEELDKRKKENEELLNNEDKRKKFFLDRFNKLVEKYGWDRKTEVVDIAEVIDKTPKIKKPTQLKPKKEFMVVLTSENCLKRVEAGKFRQTKEDEKTIKIQGNANITLVSNKGMLYKVKANAIDKCLATASGTPIASIRPELQANEKIIAIYSADVSIPNIVFITKEGYGKMSTTASTLGISKSIGAVVCGMKSETDEIIAIKLINDNEQIAITTNMREEIITFDKPQGRTSSGKRIIKFKKDEYVIEAHSV